MRTTKLAATVLILLIVCCSFLMCLADTKSGYYQYKVNSDGTAVITKYSGSDAMLLIPDKIDGHTVVEIGKRAFYGNENLEEVTIPSSVRTIGSYAFAFCDDLVTLTTHATLIQDHAFTNCGSLETVSLISEGTAVEERTFYACESLETVSGIVLNPEQYSFAFCDNLLSITISGEKVRDHAFTNCGDLETVTLLGESIIIEERAFYDCDSLKTVNGIVANVESYAFGFDKNLLSITIKGEAVADHAFTNCSKLKTVAFTTYGVAVDDRAFYDCEKLETIDGVVGNVGEYTFGFCGKLKSVRVIGTDINSNAFASCSSLLVEIPNEPAVIAALNGARVHYTVVDFATVQAEPSATPVTNNEEWQCANCGERATGKFCSNCGSPKPEAAIVANTTEPEKATATPVPTETPKPAQVPSSRGNTLVFKEVLNYILSPITDGTVMSTIDMGDGIYNVLLSNGKSFTALLTADDSSYIIECMNMGAASYDSIDDPFDYNDPRFIATLNYLLSEDNKTIVSIIPMYGTIYTAMDSNGDTYMITILCSESMVTIGLLGM